jgi:hypothetical protein
MILASTPCVYAAAPKWIELPEVKTFKGMDVGWVAKKMKYNGLPMSMQEFTADMPALELLERYEQYWKSKYDAETVRSRNGDAYVLGVEQKNYYYTVQIVPIDKKTSMGNLSVSLSPDKFKRSKDVKTEFPVPSSASQVSFIESNDSGVIAENISYSVRRTSSNVASWYESRMGRQGWALLRKTSEFGVQLYFQKNSQHAMVNIIEGKSFFNQSNVQVNWVKGNE